MLKKLIALLCATAMTCSLASCGKTSEEKTSESSSSTHVSVSTPSSEVKEEKPKEKEEKPKEPVEIVYWYSNSVGMQEYTQEVEDLLNEKLKEIEGYEHITLRLSPHKDYATDLALAQVSGEQIDLAILYGLDITKEIANGSFMPIGDLLAANPEITAELPEWFVEYGKYKGEQYYVPSYQQLCNEFFFYIPKVFVFSFH